MTGSLFAETRRTEGRIGAVQPRAFDPERYLRSNPDVRASGGDALSHWTEFGQSEEREGQRPNWRFPQFQTALYTTAHPDVVELVAKGEFDSPADHWWRAGRWEVADGRRPANIGFDETTYLDRRSDVVSAIRRGGYMSALDYWLCWGQAEDAAQGTPVERKPRIWSPTDSLSEEKQAFWKENGFVILEGLISPERCDEAVARLDAMWDTRRDEAFPFCADIFLDRSDHRRVAFGDAPDEAKHHVYKVNDTVMLDDVFREIALDPQLTEVLEWVLDGPPCVISSLNFERGSRQEYHTDTLFMPGAKPDSMTAVWFALEDISPDAGPLTYYPGSQEIPMYRFSTGKSHYVFEEWGDYVEHQMRHVDRLALIPQVFLPKKATLSSGTSCFFMEDRLFGICRSLAKALCVITGGLICCRQMKPNLTTRPSITSDRSWPLDAQTLSNGRTSATTHACGSGPWPLLTRLTAIVTASSKESDRQGFSNATAIATLSVPE